jgi:hypothetical protein
MFSSKSTRYADEQDVPVRKCFTHSEYTAPCFLAKKCDGLACGKRGTDGGLQSGFEPRWILLPAELLQKLLA